MMYFALLPRRASRPLIKSRISVFIQKCGVKMVDQSNDRKTFDAWVEKQPKGGVLSIGGWVTRHKTKEYVAAQNNQSPDQNHLDELITLSAKHITRYLGIKKAEVVKSLWSIYHDLARNNIFRIYRNYQNLDVFPGSPWLVLNSFEEYLHYCCDFVARQKRAIDEGIPPLFFVAFPKTASSFIATVLAQGLDIPACTVTIWNQERQLRRIVVPAWLRCLLLGGTVTHEHLGPFKENIEQLCTYQPNIIVHLRDPKQIVISHIHHIKKFASQNRNITEAQQWYLDKDVSQSIDSTTEKLVPFYMEWALQWYRVSQDNDLDLQFTSYEQFMEDKDMFFERIADIFSIPPEKLKQLKETQKKLDGHKGLYNIRSKRTDEWSEVMTRKQQERVDELTPREFHDIHRKTLC
jgi:hypothetical protein